MSDLLATILNVNDDEVVRYTVTRILQNAGFRVLEAASGIEALQIAQSRPDLIVLDVQLPDISGFEVCHRLKADPATAPITIIHLSASFVGSQDKAYGLEGGADGYLTQPVEPPVLVAHIKALLRMRRAEEAAQEKAIHWQTTFDAISDCIFMLDAHGYVLQCNRAMGDLLQQSAEVIKGQTLADVSPAPLDFTFLTPNEAGQRQKIEAQIGGRWFQVTTDLIRGGRKDGGSVHVMTDITQRKEAEEEITRLLRETQDSAVRQHTFMRDILSSVTEGKLFLCDSPADLPFPFQSMGEAIALTSDTLFVLRRAVRQTLDTLNFPAERGSDLTTAVSEASMNAVVHAGGGTGRIFVDKLSGKVQIWIEDHGSGIAVDRLPRATLQRGYTTAGTLGHGFKMMLQTADRVWLLTGTTGTTVVIEQEEHPPVTGLG